METQVAPAEKEKLRNRNLPLLIDTDVHEMVTGPALAEYLDEKWDRYKNQVMTPLMAFLPPYAIPLGDNRSRPEWVEPDGSKGTSPASVARHLFDDEGISVAILNGALYHPSKMTQSPEFVTALAGAYNDWQVEQWLGADERFRGSLHVIASEPEWSVREIERLAEHPQMVQVFLPTVTDREYGDPVLFPIYEAAERHGLTLTMHHGAHSLTLFGYPRYFIEWHMLAAPSAAQHQLASLITNGVFDRFQELKVVFLECSIAWVPWFMWRLDEQYKELRQEIPWVRKLPSQHVRERVRFSTQPMSDLNPDRFLKLVDMAESEEMFLFSTDYPHFDADTWDETFTSAIGDDLLHRIAYKNALDTYPRLANLRPE